MQGGAAELRLEQPDAKGDPGGGVELVQLPGEVGLDGGVEGTLSAEHAEGEVPGQGAIVGLLRGQLGEQVFGMAAALDSDEGTAGSEPPGVETTHGATGSWGDDANLRSSQDSRMR